MVLAPPAKSGLVIGDPLDCGLPELLIFPIGSSYAPEVYAGNDNSSPDVRMQGSLSWAYNAVGSGDVMNDRYASIEYVNPDDKGYDISNVLFYNKRTGESHPLHLDTLHILSFAIHKEFKTPRIFYRAVRTDVNGDTLFNGLDPVILFASKLDGDSLVQLTPSGQQFVDYHYYSDTQTILAKTVIDADSNAAFESVDETTFLEIRLNNPTMGREIFAKETKELLKKQMGIM